MAGRFQDILSKDEYLRAMQPYQAMLREGNISRQLREARRIRSPYLWVLLFALLLA